MLCRHLTALQIVPDYTPDSMASQQSLVGETERGCANTSLRHAASLAAPDTAIIGRREVPTGLCGRG